MTILGRCSTAEGALVTSDCFKLYCRGLLREETHDIWGRKVVVVGAGVAICDRRDNLIFESRKNLKSLNHFAVLSRCGGIKFASKLAIEATAFQSTSSAGTCKAMSVKETCLICFEDTPIARMFSIGTCHHKYCLACMKHHVEVNLQSGIVAQCPHKDCKCEVNIITCKKLLSPELADIMIERIKESSIPVTEKVYCAFPMCSALMSKKEVLEHTKTSFVSEGGRKCMKCQRYFCVNCKVPWHCDMSCYDYQRSETNSLAEEQLLKSLAIKKLWRQCSKCKHMVELDSGCYHITCRCGHQFCYTCGAEWKNKRATCSCPLWDEHHIIRP
ncbi:probable E3 ubiquitin-protein ligase rbrA [Prunus persica]|uniref:probable E3 ubiquitin-protein ligase rbrA n=1 Tax=Prunus persica TaxID=3760 RepID=UPI0009AB2521|nr:probable E3 ubiquitin-protein ligase rbrA [Prunus persica]